MKALGGEEEKRNIVVEDPSCHLVLWSRVIEARCSLCDYKTPPFLSHWKPNKGNDASGNIDRSNFPACTPPSVSSSGKSGTRSRFTTELEFACFVCAECGEIAVRRKLVTLWPAYISSKFVFIITHYQCHLVTLLLIRYFPSSSI